jgi:hypothetical protein
MEQGVTMSTPTSNSNTPDPKEQSVWARYIFDVSARIPLEQSIYEGLLAKGDLAVWLGREKHRKSNVLLQLAICAALARPFLHFRFCPEKPLKVVLLDYESRSQSLKQRYDAIVKGMGLGEVEKQTLRANLQVVEMRKAFRNGLEFARFPVKQEKVQADEFKDAEEEWHRFVDQMAADLYIIDPMRCMHAHAENDSSIEALLTRVHQFFADAAVLISHHLRKRTRRKEDQPVLRADMRAWADEARGSSAITAHADVVICQEREVEHELERLYLGAYMRDGADIAPLALGESEFESFYWQVASQVPEHLQRCLDALRAGGAQGFEDRRAVVAALEEKMAIGRSTAYSRVKDLLIHGLLNEEQGTLKLSNSMDNQSKPK